LGKNDAGNVRVTGLKTGHYIGRTHPLLETTAQRMGHPPGGASPAPTR
jgi:hypothetical protein